jgi:hypothetical protein
VIVAALCGAILVSLLYRHTRPITFLNDTCQFLRAARLIRRERRFPQVLEYNLMDAHERVEWDYPPLFILMLALFPPGFVERHLRAFSVANDLICMTAIGLAAWVVGGRYETGLVAMALYSFTPNVIVQRMMLTARFISIALVTVSMALVVHYLESGAALPIAAAVILAALLLLSNALATQAWFFIILSLAAFSPARFTWIVYAAASIALCYLVAGRIAWRVHRGLVVKLWVLKKYRMDDIRIGQFHLLERIQGHAPKSFSTARRDLRIIIRSVLFIDYPFIWTLAVPVLFGQSWAGSVDLTVWLALLVACHLLIDSVPALRFIGPAHRYLTYGFLPTAVFIARSIFDSQRNDLASAVLFSTFAFGIALAARRLSRLESSYDLELSSLKEIGERLRDLPIDRILVLPMPLSDTLGYFSEKKFLHGWASRAWSVGPRHGIYPVMERPLDDVIAQFELEGVVIKKDYARFDELKISAARKVADNGAYEIYAVAAGRRTIEENAASLRAASEYA